MIFYIDLTKSFYNNFKKIDTKFLSNHTSERDFNIYLKYHYLSKIFKETSYDKKERKILIENIRDGFYDFKDLNEDDLSRIIRILNYDPTAIDDILLKENKCKKATIEEMEMILKLIDEYDLSFLNYNLHDNYTSLLMMLNYIKKENIDRISDDIELFLNNKNFIENAFFKKIPFNNVPFYLYFDEIKKPKIILDFRLNDKIYPLVLIYDEEQNQYELIINYVPESEIFQIKELARIKNIKKEFLNNINLDYIKLYLTQSFKNNEEDD